MRHMSTSEAQEIYEGHLPLRVKMTDSKRLHRLGRTYQHTHAHTDTFPSAQTHTRTIPPAYESLAGVGDLFAQYTSHK